jgi:hypothetical protein
VPAGEREELRDAVRLQTLRDEPAAVKSGLLRCLGFGAHEERETI